MNRPFTDYMNHFQSVPVVTNQPNRTTDRKCMPNTTATTFLTLSTPLVVPLNFVDTQFLKNSKKNPFETNTYLNAAANPTQTLYQPHTVQNVVPFTSFILFFCHCRSILL